MLIIYVKYVILIRQSVQSNDCRFDFKRYNLTKVLNKEKTRIQSSICLC